MDRGWSQRSLASEANWWIETDAVRLGLDALAHAVELGSRHNTSCPFLLSLPVVARLWRPGLDIRPRWIGVCRTVERGGSGHALWNWDLIRRGSAAVCPLLPCIGSSCWTRVCLAAPAQSPLLGVDREHHVRAYASDRGWSRVDRMPGTCYPLTCVRSFSVADFGMVSPACRTRLQSIHAVPDSSCLSARPVRHRVGRFVRHSRPLLVRGAGIQGCRALHHLRISRNVFRLCAWSSGSVAT